MGFSGLRLRPEGHLLETKPTSGKAGDVEAQRGWHIRTGCWFAGSLLVSSAVITW